MRVKELIRFLEKTNPEALVMVGQLDDEGNTEMVEAGITEDVRTGDIEITPA